MAVTLYRPLGLGSRGYDVDGAKRAVYKLLSRKRGWYWKRYLLQRAVTRRYFGPLFAQHVAKAKNQLGVKRGKPRQFDHFLLQALYKVEAVDWLSEQLFEQARPTKVRPISGSYSIIGYPNQGTHRAYDWQSRNALDWKVPAGTPVFAPISGRAYRVGGTNGIRYVGNKIIFGMKLTIVPQSGPSVFLTHLADVRVGEGQLIRAGDKLGVVGNWGPGSHAHISIEYGDPSEMRRWPEVGGLDVA